MSVTRFVSRLGAAILLSGGVFVIACSSPESSSAIFAAPAAMPPSPDPSAGSRPPPLPGIDPPCPGYDAPVIGEACGQTSSFNWNGTCEVGHDLDRACNDVYECSNAGWKKLLRPTCVGRCPETFAEIVPGAACSDIAVGCSYLEGTCACVPDGDGGTGDAYAGPPPGIWRCAPPPGNGCPAQRPPIGSNCVRPMTCDYGACALGRDVVYSCEPTMRSWVQADSPACE